MNERSQPSSDWVDNWEPDEVVQRLRDVIDFAPHVSQEIAQQLGVGRRDVEAVAHLLSDHGPMGPAELAKRLGISGPAATQLVDRMTERGHLRRTPHHEDGRKTVVEVTPEGREDVLRLLIPMFVGFRQAAENLSTPERAVVIRFLDDCLQSMREITPGPDYLQHPARSTDD